MKYRKLPVVIEATQWHPGTDVAGVEPEMGAECDDPQCGDSTWDHACNAGGPTGRFIVRTLDGQMTVSPGDWIITGVKGERYPCKPDIFAKTYEQVAEAQHALGKLIQAHLGVEVTPAEAREVQGRIPDLVRERLRDAADQLADGLLAGDEPDIYELREHLGQHVPQRGLRISIHVHDPLTNPE